MTGAATPLSTSFANRSQVNGMDLFPLFASCITGVLGNNRFFLP